MKIPFTKELLMSLKKRGFTHIQQRGIENRPGQNFLSKEDDEYDYILIPWKKDILIFEDASMRLLEIDSNELYDMLDVEFGIVFWVDATDNGSE